MKNLRKRLTYFRACCFLKSQIAVALTNSGYVIYLSTAVLCTMVNIGVCVQLIYVIPVTLHLFGVCSMEEDISCSW